MSASGSSGGDSTSQAPSGVIDTTITTNQSSPETTTATPLPLAELLDELTQTYDLSNIDTDQRYRLVQLWKAATKMKEMSDGRLRDSQLSEQQRQRLSLIEAIKKEWDKRPQGNDNPYDDLLSYTQTARLAPMPWRLASPKKPPGGTSKRRTTNKTDITMRTTQTQQMSPNPLSMKKGKTTERSPEAPRNLGFIQRIPKDEFSQRVQQCKPTVRHRTLPTKSHILTP